MNSYNACTSCLRAARRAVRTKKVGKACQLATRPALLQQPASQPVAPPTTVGTITSNVTAATAPPPSPQPLPPLPKDAPNTAEMQRRINASLRPKSLTDTLAQQLQKKAKKTTNTYITYGLTEALFNICSSQANYTIPEAQRTKILTGTTPPKTSEGEDLGHPLSGQEQWWFTTLGMQPTFSTWSQVSFLHMYLLTVRYRALDDLSAVQNYQRYLLEHFSHAAEEKMMILHGMQAKSIRNRYLKDLFLQWRGIIAAYDEGLIRGDAVLGGAVWRNIFKGVEDVDWVKVAQVVAYMRKCVKMLAVVEADDLLIAVEGKDGLFHKAKSGLLDDVQRKSPASAETA